MRSEEQKLGTFIVDSDGTGGVKGDHSSDGESGCASVQIHVIAWARFEGRRPMDQSVAGERVCVALYVSVEPRSLQRGRGVFIVAVDHVWSRGPVEMGIIHGHLGKVWISRTPKGMREDEMKEDTLTGYQALSGVNSGGVARNWD